MWRVGRRNADCGMKRRECEIARRQEGGNEGNEGRQGKIS